jgi:hypothetical protein
MNSRLKALQTKAKAKRFDVFRSYGFRCVYCGGRPGADHLHVDHFIPKSRGGSDNPENLVCACEKCNLAKSNEFWIPQSLGLPQDEDGAVVVRAFGVWCVKVWEQGVCVSGAVYRTNDVCKTTDCYEPVSIHQCRDAMFRMHVSDKQWGHPHSMFDYDECCAYMNRLFNEYVPGF